METDVGVLPKKDPHKAMARDRTAAFKGGNSSNTNAANNWEQDVQQQPNYTNAASAAYPPAQPITRPDEVLLSAAKDMDTFYRQRDVLTQYINRIEYNIDQIKQLNLRSLSEVNQNAAARLKTQCEDLTAETSKLVQFTRDGVKMLHQSRKGDKNIRKGQYNFLLQKLQGVTRNFIQVENDIKLSKKDQIARQYRIAKPNATDAEIQEAIDSGRTDVFNQLMLNSRVANQQKVLGEVQDRQKELEKVLKSMSELQDIMIEMNTLINNQQEMIDETETYVESTVVNMQDAGTALTAANKSAARARKTKWIIFWIVLVILIIIAIVVAIQVSKKN